VLDSGESTEAREARISCLLVAASNALGRSFGLRTVTATTPDVAAGGSIQTKVVGDQHIVDQASFPPKLMTSPSETCLIDVMSAQAFGGFLYHKSPSQGR